MASFDREVLETATRQREVTLATVGRKSGKTYRVTIWLVTHGERVSIRSGQGLRRHCPQNLLARGEAELQLAKLRVKVKPRLVTERDEARAVSGLYRRKHDGFGKTCKTTQP